MDCKENKNTEHLTWLNNAPLKLGAVLSAPFILATVIILSLSYITNFVIAGKADILMEESSGLPHLLYDCGNLLSKLIFPLISAGIAMALEGGNVIGPGLLGGMLAVTGATFERANSNATGVSGIFGCIFAGFAAGYSARLIRKGLMKLKKAKETLVFFLIPILSLTITLFAVIAINTLSEYINSTASGLAGLCANTNGLLLSALLGLFMTAEFGGPLYIAGYTFGVAALATGDGRYMAAVIAAGAVPSITMGLYTNIIKEQASRYERILGAVGLLGGLLGLPHCAICFYTKKTYKFTLACITGGIAASALSYSFYCESSLPAGGIMGIVSTGRFMFFITSLCSACLLSTFLLSLTEKEKQARNSNEQKESNEQHGQIPLQI